MYAYSKLTRRFFYTYELYLEHVRLQIFSCKLIIAQIQFREINYLFEGGRIDLRDLVLLQNQFPDLRFRERFNVNQLVPFERRQFYAILWPLRIVEVVGQIFVITIYDVI